jgi:hypothetical protein
MTATPADTLTDLIERRAEAVERHRDLAQERETIAYDAATGAAGARRRLEVLTRSAVDVVTQIENLDSAIAEGRRRVATAEAEARAAQHRDRARVARARLAELRAVGDTAGAALTTFVGHLGRLYDLTDETRRLGFGGPSRDAARVFLTRQLQAELMKVQLHTETIPPNDRIGVAALIEGWSEPIERRIAAALGEIDEAA